MVFDNEQPIRPGFQSYVLYDRANEFPRCIEVLSDTQRERGSNSEPELERGSNPVEQDVEVGPAAEQWAGTDADLERLLEQDQELDALKDDEWEPQPNPDAEPFEVEVASGHPEEDQPDLSPLRKGSIMPAPSACSRPQESCLSPPGSAILKQTPYSGYASGVGRGRFL